MGRDKRLVLNTSPWTISLTIRSGDKSHLLHDVLGEDRHLLRTGDSGGLGKGKGRGSTSQQKQERKHK